MAIKQGNKNNGNGTWWHDTDSNRSGRAGIDSEGNLYGHYTRDDGKGMSGKIEAGNPKNMPNWVQDTQNYADDLFNQD